MIPTGNRCMHVFVTMPTVLLMLAGFADGAPAPEEFIDLLQQTNEQVDNLSLQAVWSEYEDGNRVEVEKQTIHRDRLGRIRVQYDIEREGAEPEWHDELYNGEVTLVAVEDETPGSPGGENDDESGAPEQRRHAYLYNGLKSGMDPAAHRNPFTASWIGVVGDLSRVLAAGEDVEVIRREDLGDVFELRYRMPLELDPFERKHVVLVDAAKDWAVLSVEQFFPDGKLGLRKTYEYVLSEHGLWLPAAGRTGSWGKTRDVSESPLWEWDFRVERIVVNDPEFDESVFEPTLPPDTYVNDLRHDATYRVGSEEAIGEELSLLAQQARAEEEANLQRIKEGVAALKAMKESESAWRIGNRLRFALVAINVAVVAALAAVWWFRRKAGK